MGVGPFQWQPEMPTPKLVKLVKAVRAIESEGFRATLNEIANRLETRSRSGLSKMVTRAVDLGYLRKERYGAIHFVNLPIDETLGKPISDDPFILWLDQKQRDMDGASPSFAEMTTALGTTSKNTVWRKLEKLEKEGAIKRATNSEKRRVRHIEIVRGRSR